MKKLIIILSLLGCSHVAPLGTTKVVRQIGMHFAQDIDFTKDQVIFCPYSAERSVMLCMTPEEFQMRAELEKDIEPKDPDPTPDSLPACDDAPNDDGKHPCLHHSPVDSPPKTE